MYPSVNLATGPFGYVVLHGPVAAVWSRSDTLVCRCSSAACACGSIARRLRDLLDCARRLVHVPSKRWSSEVVELKQHIDEEVYFLQFRDVGIIFTWRGRNIDIHWASGLVTADSRVE